MHTRHGQSPCGARIGFETLFMRTKLLTALGVILQPVFFSAGVEPPKSSYAPVVAKEPFSETMARMKAEKPAVMKKQMDLLRQRYDLRNDPAPGVTMSGGKPVQQGRARETQKGDDVGQARRDDPGGDSGEGCFPGWIPAAAAPESSRGRHGLSEVSTSTNSRSRKQRDLTRFDLDFDLPDHFLPEFPAPIFLTTRPDLGDVSKGKLRDDRQLLRAVRRHPESEATRRAAPAASRPFRSSSSTATDDRRSERPHRGVSLFRLPRQRPHQRRDASRPATSGRRNSGIASTRRRCAG